MREAAGAYGEKGSYRSAPDITGPESLATVRAHKQEMKRAAKAAPAAKKVLIQDMLKWMLRLRVPIA